MNGKSRGGARGGGRVLLINKKDGLGVLLMVKTRRGKGGGRKGERGKGAKGACLDVYVSVVDSFLSPKAPVGGENTH